MNGHVHADTRQDPSKRLLLTGGTGFLGSHIGARLLERGRQVVFLARSSKGVPAAERIAKLLDWHGVPPSLRENATVVEGDLGRADLGIEPEALRRVKRTIDEIIHCASDTSFAERNRERIARTNLDGLRHVLDLASESGCAAFHHISTAYVAGRQSGICREQLVQGVEFHNAYEETKCQGEWMAWERCQAQGITLTIHRPSIVYGHSQTGRTLSFNALYYPVRTALLLKKVYETDIHQRGGKKAAEVGVRIEPDGTFYLPIRIEVDQGGGLNVIPVDFFSDAFFAIREGAPQGGIYHIVNEANIRLETLIEYGTKLFHVSGVRPCPTEEYQRGEKNALETLYETYLEAYRPYMRDRRIFATDNAGPILKEREITCPQLDDAIFARCMNYAVQVGWSTHLDGQ